MLALSHCSAGAGASTQQSRLTYAVHQNLRSACERAGQQL